MDSLIYRNHVLTCYSMFELSIYPLVKKLCTQLNCIILFLGYPIIYRMLQYTNFIIYNILFIIMSKVIIIIIKDLLLN